MWWGELGGKEEEEEEGEGEKEEELCCCFKKIKMDNAAIDLFFTKYSQVTENFVKKSCWACSLKSRGYHVESIFHFLTELGLVNKTLANH